MVAVVVGLGLFASLVAVTLLPAVLLSVGLRAVGAPMPNVVRSRVRASPEPGLRKVGPRKVVAPSRLRLL